VVYRERRPSGAIQLFSVPIAGGGPVNLSPNLIADGDVFSFEISPNSQQVVYIADPEVDDMSELYRVSITGGDVEKLNGSLVDQYRVSGFKISPDSRRVVYFGFREGAKLFSVPINGGTGIKLDDLPMTAVLAGFDYQISLDSQKIIYLADQNQRFIFELYSTSITGGRVSKLNANLPFQSGVNNFQISPDGKFVVYRSDQNVFDKFELFAVELEDEGDEFCVPIKAQNGNVAIICL